MKTVTCPSAIAVILFCNILLFGCKKNDLTSGKKTEPVGALKALKNLGYDTSGVVDMGDHYLVENDIVISKSLLSGTLPRQAYGGNSQLVGVSKQRSMTIRIDNSVPSNNGNLDWRNEVPQAIAVYNNLATSNIRFTLVTSATADIVIKTGSYSATSSPARAPLPSGGNPGSYVEINTSFTGTLSSIEKVYTLVHELGHCIGLKHTDWYNDTVVGDGPYPAVGNSPNDATNEDTESIMMHSIPWFIFSVEFSAWDMYAISFLYPSSVLQITAQSPICGNSLLTIEGLSPQATVNWSVSSSASTLSCTNCHTPSLVMDNIALPGLVTGVTATISYNGQNVLQLYRSVYNYKNQYYTFEVKSYEPYVNVLYLQPNTTYNFYIEEGIPGQISWDLPQGFVMVGDANSSSIYVTTPSVFTEPTGNIFANIVTDCGNTVQGSIFFAYDN
ncbi:M57 family metalloprotease [Niabella sp. CJ426]|uniref:M57 family metalloprotease n=1 Tax=Niabella sp. CJ426 TaxID=3393740 RepID=UPI003CFC29DC